VQILLIDDNEQLSEVLKDNFSFVGHYMFFASNSKKGFGILKKEEIHVILLDIRLGDENGVDILKKIKVLYPNIPVIMITGFATIDVAVNAMKHGAYDFVKKPINFNTLCARIDTVTNNIKFKKENTNLKKRIQEKGTSLVSNNDKYNEVICRAKKLSASNISILIIGENGSGKEILADYIYNNSNRISEKFIKINCAAFPETLLDNELFGHEKGAFTGADTGFTGVFEQADKGTLLLDEIGDMPLTLQSKILRVLQNQEIRRIGGKSTRKIDIRFIASTNKDLSKLVDEGKFRKDLFYRLNGGMLRIPPLRERKEDIKLLIDDLLKGISTDSKVPQKSISKQVENIFRSYGWPGNIRELKNALVYANVISQSDVIECEDLPPSFGLVANSCDSQLSLIQEKERDVIKKILMQNNNNKTETAKVLKMSRNTLYLKLKKYGITINE
jgi:DNA-binding NtrC family response regulator